MIIVESELSDFEHFCIYVVCVRSPQKMFVHLLGGAGMARPRMEARSSWTAARAMEGEFASARGSRSWE